MYDNEDTGFDYYDGDERDEGGDCRDEYDEEDDDENETESDYSARGLSNF